LKESKVSRFEGVLCFNVFDKLVLPGQMVHHVKMGSVIKKCVHQLPLLDLEATIQPITRTVLRVRLTIDPLFNWDDKVKGVLLYAYCR